MPVISTDDPTNDFLKILWQIKIRFVTDREIKVVKTEILFPFKNN